MLIQLMTGIQTVPQWRGLQWCDLPAKCHGNQFEFVFIACVYACI
jgi:hypothetical protein